MDGTLTTRDMARRLGVQDNSSSELLKELGAKGLAERTSCGWRATAVGRAKVARYLPTHE